MERPIEDRLPMAGTGKFRGEIGALVGWLRGGGGAHSKKAILAPTKWGRG
jgi:hypothetical protein